MNTHSRVFKTTAQLLIAVMCGQPLLAAAAGLSVDTRAGANTQITQAGNGVPVVNIATPNGKGLSHNKFTDYNVAKQGLILNNSTDKFTQTQLGGIIIGNSKLKGKSAQIILNEVTGGQASQLKGYTEVAGKQAHVVVANPHGVTCDGCGFINTPRVTLTTGKPIIEQGQLKRYDVEGGQIEIAGAGLNATNVSQFDLITRSAKINAELHANQLNIITGRNSVDAQTLTATAKADRPDDKPSLAIDSSALGGMYAGTIRLVGTEAGVGVKLAGDMAASAGDIRIDANGKLSLARTAASRDLQLNAENIELNADAYAGREVRIKTPQLNVKDSLAAGERISLHTQRLDNMGLIEAGVRADGRVNSASQLKLISVTVDNHGQITSQGSIRGDIQQLDNRSGRISSAGDTQLLVEQLNNREGQIVAQGSLGVEVEHLDNRQGILLAQRSLSVMGETLDNSSGGTLAADAYMDIQLTGALNNNQGLLETGTHLRFVADSLSNAQGQIRALGEVGQSSLVTTGLLNNNQGLIEVGNATLRLESNHLNNEGGYVRHLGKDELQVDMDALGQAGGSFMTNSMLHLSAEEWVNRSLVQAASIELNIERLTQTSSAGLLTAGRLDGHGENWINDGRMEADHDLNIELSGTYQGNGSLIAQGHLGLNAADVDLASNARLQAGGYGWLNVLGTFANQGQVAAVDWLELSAKSLQNRGSLGTGGELLLVAPDIRNEEGLIFSGEDMRVLSQRIENRRGDFYSLGNLLITGDAQGAMAERLSNLSGSIEAAGNLGISALQIENAREAFDIRKYKYSARLVHVGCTDCSGTNEDALFRLDEIERTEIINTSPQAQLLSGGAMALHSDEMDNRYSLIASGGDLQVSTGHLNNQGAQTGDVHASRVLKSHRVRAHRVGYQINDANIFSARNWHGSASYSPGNINAELNSFFNRHIYSIYSASVPALKNTQYHHATIQAAGNLQVEAKEQINNSLIRPSFSYVAGGDRDVNTHVPGSSIATIVPLNSQRPPDLAQQAVSVPSFTLPGGSNGLFSLSSSPVHSYLIETNPLLTDMRQYLSSDYLLGQLGLSTDNMQKRLGDGLYEQRLLREAWTARTGQRFIAGIDSDEAIYRYLMDNAIASKDALSLSLGVSLTSEQVAALTHDIVWMEEREVRGETVLVPVLYMAQAQGRLAPSGALIQGHDIVLISGEALNNQGTLRASSSLSVNANNMTNSGLIHAGERLSLLAEGSIHNRQGGILAGRDVVLTALTGDILNERTVTHHESAAGNSRWESSFADSAARIDATRDLTLSAGRDVQNQGSVLDSRGDLHITAGRDVNLASVEERHSISRGSHYINSQTTQLSSETRAGGNLSIQAGRDLTAIASRVQSGKDMQLIAGNDLTLATAANESHHYSKSKKRTSQRDQVRQVGTEVISGGQFTAVAGQDLTLVSSSVVANDEAYLVAGGKVQLLAAQDYDYSFSEKKKKGSFGRKNYRMSESDNSTAVVSSIQAGIDLLMHGAEAVVSQGAQLQAGQHLELQSGGDILLLAAENSSTQASAKSKSGLLSSKGKTSSQSQTQVVGTTADAGSILIAAGQDLQVSAGDLRAQGDMALQAGRDVELSSAMQYSNQSQSKHSSKLGFSHHALLTHTQKQQVAKQGSGTAVGSYLSADNLLISGGRDTRIQGSTLISERDMHISTGRDLNIVSAENTSHSSTSSSSKKTGEIGSWWQPAIGQVKQKVKTQGETLQQSGSQLASLAGNIHLQAGETYQQTASGVLALEGDIHIQGKQVNIEAGYDQLSHSETRSANRTAVGGTVSIPVVNAIQSMQQVNKARERTDDPRMQTLAAATLAMQGKAAYDGAQALYNGNVGGIKISLNLSNNNSKSHSTQQGQNVSASSVIAGGDIHVQATGAQDSDLNIIGSRLSAGQDIRLAADRNILLRAAENTATQSSRDSGGGWSVGVGFGLGGSQNGFTLDLAANQFRGKSDGSDSLWSNTQVEAARRVHLESGADTRLQGAVVKGEQVTADIGGNLLLESLQDRSTYQSKQSSSSAGVSLCIPPFCAGTSTASASQSNSKAQGDYASVNQQTGIQAGDGGFQLKVNGRTDLTGAVIASSEQAVQDRLNWLETGTLMVRDIENYSKYKASSSGLVASVGFGIGQENKAAATTDQDNSYRPDLTGSAVSKISGSDSSVTRSGISQADIVITDLKAQQELTGQTATALLDKLNDAVHSGDGSGGIDKNWDGKKLERVVQVNAEIMTAFSQQAGHAVSAYVQNKREELLEQKRNADSTATQEEIQGQINALNTQERVMKTVIGALTGQLDTAVAHAVLQEAADQMRQYSIESSSRFAGVIVGEDEQGSPLILSNISGDSAGVRGDGIKLGGVRVDLDLICGKTNQRCATLKDENDQDILDSRGIPVLKLENGMVQYDARKAKMSFDDFKLTKDGQKMSGLTGGVQGFEGTMAGKPYAPNSFWDYMVESFAGTHDTIGGGVTGLYDEQGNTTRGLSDTQNTGYNIWSVIAIAPSAPFALSEALPSEAWQVLGLLLKGQQ